MANLFTPTRRLSDSGESYQQLLDPSEQAGQEAPLLTEDGKELLGVLDRPFGAPVGLFESYMEHDKMQIIATHENRYTVDLPKRYKIMDACTGENLFVPSYKFLSQARLPTEVSDANGTCLFKFRNGKFWQLNYTFLGKLPEDEDTTLFTINSVVEGGWKTTKLVLTYTDARTGSLVEITMEEPTGSNLPHSKKGIFRLTSADSNPIIGYRLPKMPTNLHEEHPDSVETRAGIMAIISYYLVVAPGVDIVLLVAMCLAVDEIRKRTS